VAERFNPWSLYWYKETKHRVMVISFEERAGRSVTLKVYISTQWNLVDRPSIVFGVDPEDLGPCETPAAGERLGTTAMLTDPEEVRLLRSLVYERLERGDISQARPKKAKRRKAKTRNTEAKSGLQQNDKDHSAY
jgi:hypothetical protein